MSVSAHTIRTRVLEPAMDGIVLNEHQTRLIYDPSPEVDSLVEHLAGLTRHDPGLAAQLMTFARKLLEANTAEGERLHRIAGTADEAARILADEERNGAARVSRSLKAIAARARGPLRVIAHPGEYDAHEFVGAVRTIDGLLLTLTSDVLGSPSLRAALGDGPHDLLLSLAESRGL